MPIARFVAPLAPSRRRPHGPGPAGIPAEFSSERATFTIGGLPQYDNGAAEVKVGWEPADADDRGNPVDWDVYVYDDQGRQVASAASLDDPEVAVLIDPVPGEYTVVVENYDGGDVSDWSGEVSFRAPTPATYTGVKEAWTMTCAKSDGTVVASRSVVVDRGESVDVGKACQKAKD
ncbi:hypothetical protein GCM10023168_24420 [Fodinibacter luteus]|uniref:Uncharacterized protein n=1 Tax=Fodinibacter luteus TaxID=552064 RepID=A0ABP8KIF9_9MICO